MARPIKEGMDYFPHDVNASTDKKIEALRALYGNDGYAFYFIMLEQIYQEPSFELDVSDAETREEMWQILSRKIAITTDVFKQILKTALNWDCFDKELYNEKGILTSRGIKKRASIVTDKRDKMREKYQQTKAVVSDAETPPETKEETPQSKEKKKESKSKDKNYSLEISQFRSRYSPEQLEIIDRYFEVLRTTRRSGTIAESIIHGVYEDMNKYDPVIVQYACLTVTKKPELHDKKENYFAGILRNTTVAEALKGLDGGQRASPPTSNFVDMETLRQQRGW